MSTIGEHWVVARLRAGLPARAGAKGGIEFIVVLDSLKGRGASHSATQQRGRKGHLAMQLSVGARRPVGGGLGRREVLGIDGKVVSNMAAIAAVVTLAGYVGVGGMARAAFVLVVLRHDVIEEGESER